MIDIHSHILPDIDDGSKSCEMSLNMLKESYRQNVSAVVATPHFYIKDDTIESFLQKRDKSYSELKRYIENESELPDIYLGAEVFYFNGISKMENIDKLAINGGKYLLLEMPFNKWNSRVLQEVEDLIYNCKLTPVIAHIERFVPFQKGTDNIEKLISMKVIVQMNGEYLFGFFNRRKALKLVSSGVVQLIGSDMHNIDKRPQNLGEVCDIIKDKLGKSVLEDIENMSKRVIGI